MFSVDGIAVYS